MNQLRKFECCLCGQSFAGFGNNPAPLAELPNLCCDMCNQTKVIPARFAISF
jgi:hypothetical protein